ncbi:MAG: fumarylacetoacetate hydrolase family protein [Burkholderiaceae bacterium]|nr:fumarylacetoacetate hydrolase family protein [Burkholderiaceae bacterium]
MKFAAFKLNASYNDILVGIVSDDEQSIQQLDFDAAAAAQGVAAVVLAQAKGQALPQAGKQHALSSIKLLAPIPRPARNVFCVGKNYFAHAKEFAQSGFDSSAKAGEDIPTDPIIFTKLPETVIATGDPILIPKGVSEAIDYEAELGVIIGKQGKGISEASAMDYVWGYTVINDVTARDWQNRHKQWFMGKSFDTFCPMGPWAVTKDACNGENTQVRCFVNGEQRQNASTTDLIFNIPKLIATLSAGITLYPGDIIATGTPVGVGIGFKPPKYLVAGDRVRVEIDGIGAIENPLI